MTKILVVDDELLVLATTSMGLQQMGYDVIQADSGAWALQVCQQEEPDLVLLDICMPAMSGVEVAKVLDELNIPFIFLSAYSDEEMIKSAAAVGALGYLVKPLEIARIVPAIEVALVRADEQAKADQTLENLINSLENNREIDVAIGMLMERYKIGRVTAFESLRSYARANRTKVVELANALISGAIKQIPINMRPRNFRHPCNPAPVD
ncbi:MAG: two-component system response regulator [Methylomonas sp.]|nr:MAG: two-component system response regulator [Methylomonas sp.]